MSVPERTVLITGGTAGVGYEAALAISRQCPDYIVVIASRTDPKSAATSINKTLNQQNVEYMPLDLSSPANVRAFAKSYETKQYPPLQALVLNAGLQFPNGLVFTDEGLEKTFAINHVGNALLFHLLRPQLAEKARVVITSSGTHDPAQKTGFPDAEYTTGEQLARPDPKTAHKDGRQRYATSKLVNIMWAYALNRRFAKVPEKHWTVNAFDPGLMPGTGLAREYPAFLRFIWLHVMPHMLPLLRLVMTPNMHTTKESGSALARAAVGEDVDGVSGKYLEGTKEIKSSTQSYDEAKQEDLWTWTVKYVAENEDELRAFDSFS